MSVARADDGTVAVSTVEELLFAIREARPGDRIELADGTYKIKRKGLSVRNAGTAEAPIVVRAAHLGAAKIEFEAIEGFMISGPYWTFENLDIDDPRSAAIARLFLGWANALNPATQTDVRLAMAESAHDILREWDERLPVDLADALGILASNAHAEGRVEDARRHATLAWQLTRDAEVDSMWFGIAGRARVGRAFLTVGMYREAEVLLTPALERISMQLGSEHVETEGIRRLLHDVYTALGRPDEALRLDESPK